MIKEGHAEIKVTTALNKIAGLSSRIWGIQGGQGAGKTFSICLMIIDYAISTSGARIYIASAELSKMRDTVLKDFCDILDMRNIYCTRTGIDFGAPYVKFPNGSFVRFLGLDKDDIGKGLRSELVFVNEANKIDFETYRQLTSRAKRVIIDFNPDSKFWFHAQVQPDRDCQTLVLTYKDNECCPDNEVREIEGYREKGYKKDSKGKFLKDDRGEDIIINQYWANKWQIYGLGMVGQVEGRIYHWNSIALEDYQKIEKTEQFYIDFGKVDPCAIGGVKYDDGNLYLDELNYASENELERSMTTADLHRIRGLSDPNSEEKNSGMMPWLLSKLKISTHARIICENRPHKILSIREAGWEYAKGIGAKPTLKDRVDILSNLNIYYTDRSKNIEVEQENYAYAKDRNGVTLPEPIDKDNHHMDGAAYSVFDMFREGVIGSV